jgi:hypothetical protein
MMVTPVAKHPIALRNSREPVIISIWSFTAATAYISTAERLADDPAEERE